MSARHPARAMALAITTNHILRNAGSASVASRVRVPPRSVRGEGGFVVLREPRVLFLLAEIAVARREHVDLAAHETPKGIFGRADDRFAPDVEARVDDDGAAGA